MVQSAEISQDHRGSSHGMFALASYVAVLADTRAAKLLAASLLAVVLADARPDALPAAASLGVVLADA